MPYAQLIFCNCRTYAVAESRDLEIAPTNLRRTIAQVLSSLNISIDASRSIQKAVSTVASQIFNVRHAYLQRSSEDV